jgi:hypothetical protein
MIRLTAGHARKIGEPGYSSRQFCAEISIELSEADGPKVAERLAVLWATLRASVDAEAARAGLTPVVGSNGSGHVAPLPHGNGNATQIAAPSGNGHCEAPVRGAPVSEPAISDKQAKFLRGLIARARTGVGDVNRRARELFNRPDASIENLSSREASALIEELRAAVEDSQTE